jgi:hypothetical protein
VKVSPPPFAERFDLQFGVAVVDGDASGQVLDELHSGTGEAEPPRLRRDLEATTVPLHDVIIADDAFVDEAADAIQLARCWAPGLFRLGRGAAEAAVVVGQEAAQDVVGGEQIGGSGQAQLAAQAILEDAPEPLDAALGLRALGGDEGDPELLERPAELGGLLASGQLLFHRPVVVVAHEDARAVAVDAEGHPVAAQESAKDAEIAVGRLGGEELGSHPFAGGVVLKAEQGDLRATTFQPVVGAGIDRQPLALSPPARAALTMGGWAAFAWRADPGGARVGAEAIGGRRIVGAGGGAGGVIVGGPGI